VELFKQALLNVAVNARQAMPDGGELRIEAAAEGENVELRTADKPVQMHEWGLRCGPYVRAAVCRCFSAVASNAVGSEKVLPAQVPATPNVTAK
jgi:hypothetical protein